MKTTEPEKPTSTLSKAVLVRVDSSTRIGTGHAMRCLTLANQLREHGRVVTFIARAHPGNINRKIKDEGFELLELPASSQDAQNLGNSDYSAWLGTSQEQDRLETLKVIGDRKFEWLVIDHYALDTAWESPMREVARKIMVIDDLANRQHDCDLLLDQNFYLDAQTRYQNLAPPTATCLLGPEYALLRPEFYEARANLRERNGEVTRVLVCMGGSDAFNVTGEIVDVLLDKRFEHVKIDVVVGPSNSHQKTIERIVAGRPQFRLLTNVLDMASLMAEADFAIGGGGSMLWERAFLSLPSLVIPIAHNQIDSVANAEKGALLYAISLRDFHNPPLFSDVVFELLEAKLSVAEQVRRLHAFFEGYQGGLVRDFLVGVREVFQETIRPVDSQDEQIVWNFFLDPELRRFALRESIDVSRKSHGGWFQETFAENSNRVMYLAENRFGPIGLFRFDLCERGWEIDFILARQFRGVGLGSELLARAMELIAEVRDFSYFARVHPENVASQRVFERLGFIECKINGDIGGFKGYIHDRL